MKRIRGFEYRLGDIRTGLGGPVHDRAFIEIVDADDPQILLGEINIEINDAKLHAEQIIAALAKMPR